MDLKVSATIFRKISTGGEFIDGVKGAAIGIGISAAIKWAMTPASTGGASATDGTNQEGSGTEGQRDPGKIYVTGHRVGEAGPTHLALESDGGAGTEWLSGGPDGVSAEGFKTLKAGIGNATNGVRPSDAPALNVTLGEVTPPSGMSIKQYFNVLKNATSNCCKGVDYDLFPSVSDGYNSNSFVSGLIKSTGGSSSVNMNNYVGGSKPLPPQYFAP